MDLPDPMQSAIFQIEKPNVEKQSKIDGLASVMSSQLCSEETQ